MSVRALDEMKLNATSNVCESVNRAMSARLPKNVVYSRNAEGRAQGAAHSVNNGIFKSLAEKVHSLGAPLGSGAARALKNVEQKLISSNNSKKHNKSKSLENRRQQAAGYLKKKLEGKTTDRDYSKRCEEPRVQLRPIVNDDQLASTSSAYTPPAVGPSVASVRTSTKRKRPDHAYARGDGKKLKAAAPVRLQTTVR